MTGSRRSGPARTASAHVLASLALSLGACATTHRARSAEPSGFLGSYELLAEGDEDQPLRVYRDEAADLSRYERVLLDPVVAYAREGGTLGRLDEERVRALLDYFDAALRREIGGALALADAPAPAPDVVRVRVALTDARGSSRLRNLTSTVLPYGRALSTLKRLAVGSHVAVGGAQMEAEVVDSNSGARLAAVLDARVGTKVLEGVLERWSDTQEAMDFWAARLARRLVEAKEEAR